MKNKYIALVILLILLAVIAFGISYFKPEKSVDANTPAESKSESNETVLQYVRSNISTLSPVKEQLGGTFYVTKIEAHGGAGTVSYEDGHNAYVADFTYLIDEESNPSIIDFKVRQ